MWKDWKREGGDEKDTMKNPFSSMNIRRHEWQERFDLYCETALRTADVQKNPGKKADSRF